MRLGKALDAGMGLLIEGEIVGAECDGQSCGLTKAEGHALAGNGIDGSGGIANEGNVATGYPAEFASEGDGASCWAFGLRCGEVMAQSGEMSRGHRSGLDNFLLAMKATQTSLEEVGVT